MIRNAVIATTALALASCSGVQSEGTTHAHVAPMAATIQDTTDTAPSFTGIGPLHFGMTEQQLRRAWGRPLHGDVVPSRDPQACHYLNPHAHDHTLLFMVEGDRFVRIDVTTNAETAPGGGRTGMTAQQIESLYAGRITVMPGKYDANEKILRVTPHHAKNEALIFETDAAGVVKTWRVGMTPQIDYVEGCS